MSSLFFKTFAVFWAAMALLVLVLAGVDAYSSGEPREPPRRALLGDALTLYGRNAADVYARGGQSALRRELARIDGRALSDAYLFDESGRELSGQTPPDEVREIAMRATRRGRERWRSSDGFQLWASPVARGRVFAARIERPVFGRRVNARTRLLRSLALILSAGLVCGVLAMYLSAPVSRLRAATQRLAQGDLTARANVTARRRDELALLAQDFDGMAARLETLVGAQKRLLGDISHELRSPLARLNVALELATRNRDEETRNRHLDRIRRESARLDALIADLLLLSRGEADTELRRELVDLRALARGVVEDADFEARASEKRVTLQDSDEKLFAPGDAELLRRALENVVRNALRHTPTGTTVSVETSRDGENARLLVRDAGQGVPAEALETIFEPFFRVDDSRDHASRDQTSGGSGLGLAIARRALLQHNGTVRARNLSSGGLEVELRVPIERKS